ncbi:FMN-binding negative transcriptional regulator [Acidimangrovimonas pyrenivorans]|uniref:FMN-binding negative transcriptional regulator n=1 Tax=Acidimangrovimonas pyrenivorans TaxID=2030798 RepID=A0ABV7AKA5_9RHOB
MHPNPAFRQTPAADNLAFARSRGFGTLAVNAAATDSAGPLLSHLPFLLSEDGSTAECHLVRSNPIARALATPQPAVLSVTGPEGYISPDWYGLDDQVPTWNYVAVHLRGTLELLPATALRDQLDRLSARFEAELAPKPQWTAAKMPEDLLARMMRQIVPCRLTVTEVQGTWKLAQNKPEAARLAAARAVAAAGRGPAAAELARLMEEATLPPSSE